MQLFRSEEDVAAWSRKTSTPMGAVFSTERLGQLASKWYDDRLELNWRRRSIAERQQILEDVGLTGPHWSLV